MTPACPNTDPPSSSSMPHRTKSSNPLLPPSATKSTPKKNQFPRKALRDLKLSNSSHGSSSSSSSSSSSNGSSMSTSLSIEAPKGCLRFFQSNSSSMKTPLNRCTKTLPTTPKSAPNANASKHYSKSRHMISKEKSSRPTISEKFKKNPPSRYQSGKKPISRDTHKPTFSFPSNSSHVRKFTSGEVELNLERRVDDSTSSDKTYTPLTKLSIGSCLDGRVGDKIINDERSNTSTNKTKTPPVQASVSPEIQCGSSLFSSATPACYAAGYVVSGVTDKRKCRPRGILTVGDNDLEFGIAKALNDFDHDDDDEGIDIDSSSVSMVPLPAEASMHWHLSPCNEDEDYNSDDCSWKFGSFDGREASQSPSNLSDHQFTSDICMMSGSSIDINSIGRKKSTCLVSPSEVNDFEGFVSPVYDSSTIVCSPCATTATLKDPDEDRKYCFSTEEVNSPFSMDTLGSENVIQTPESESSSERYAGLSWSNGDDHLKHDCDPELNSVVKKLQMTSLSPKSHASVRGPSSSSFEFDTLTAPSSSIDTSQFQKSLGNPDSWISNSVRDDMSQPHRKISWKEKSVSRVFEMDEFDNCRCFSDEEEDDNDRSKDQLKSFPRLENSVDVENQPISTNASTHFLDKISVTEAKDRGSLPPFVPCTCAESISTDGGGLDRSEDSDWTLCYKDQSFQL